jgi:hypothetical protein
MTLVSVIASRAPGAAERIATFAPLNAPGVAGFHLTTKDGAEVWYQAAGLGTAKLVCGPGTATAQALLVVRQGRELTGLVAGAQTLTLAGRPVAVRLPDFEFTAAGARAAILRPIDPVSFRPNRSTFAEQETVEMVSATPGVEIRYTTDGSPPTRQSTLYRGPLKITESAAFAARAFYPMPAEDFEINGTHFSEPTWAWFTKAAPQPALAPEPANLALGLQYDYVEAPWWRLYANAHWLPATRSGAATRELDLSSVQSKEPYAMRYRGFLRVPKDGLYTFHAPPELANMGWATSYDLRVYVEDQEWDLTQWWHGHGTWSVPLKAGLHRFQVDFADARSDPWRKSGMWRYYPRPWAVYQGPPSPILLSGPGFEPAQIPAAWLLRERRSAVKTAFGLLAPSSQIAAPSGGSFTAAFPAPAGFQSTLTAPPEVRRPRPDCQSNRQLARDHGLSPCLLPTAHCLLPPYRRSAAISSSSLFASACISACVGGSLTAIPSGATLFELLEVPERSLGPAGPWMPCSPCSPCGMPKVKRTTDPSKLATTEAAVPAGSVFTASTAKFVNAGPTAPVAPVSPVAPVAPVLPVSPCKPTSPFGMLKAKCSVPAVSPTVAAALSAGFNVVTPSITASVTPAGPVGPTGMVSMRSRRATSCPRTTSE